MRRFAPLAVLLSSGAALAAGGDAIVVRAGSATLDAATVARRLSAVPAYQLAALAAEPTKARRAFADQVLVPELLHAEEARARKLDQKPAVQDKLREILRQAMELELRRELEQKRPVTADEVKAYFDANRSRFETPRRIRIWRIVVKDEALAKKIIEEARGVDGPTRWSALAREHSIDKATHLRSGDLGFVRADGSTDTPRVRVNPALFAAVDGLKDGEILPEPLPDGPNFAVLWRRGSMPGVTRTLEQEEQAIRTLLERERLEKAQAELLASLRAKYVSGVQENLLEYVTIDGFGDVAARQRPGVVPRRSQAGATPPAPGERGNR